MHHVRQEDDYNSDRSVTLSGSQEGREDIPALQRVWDTKCQIGPTPQTRHQLEKNLVDVTV